MHTCMYICIAYIHVFNLTIVFYLHFLAAFEPLGGVYIGPGEEASVKPTLFVLSCGEGHLDLRTADKVMQTIHSGQEKTGGLPSPSSVISEKNYIMVWDVTA